MRGPFDFIAALKLAAYAREVKADTLCPQFPRENYISVFASKLCGAKVIYTSHVYIKDAFWRRIINKILTRNVLLIAVCKDIERQAKENGYKKSVVIYNGAPKANLSVAPAPPPFIFVSLMRLSEEKGVFFLLEAIEILAKKTEFIFFIAGSGPLEEQAKERAIGLPVKFLGQIKNPEEILSKAHCYINSSKSEALSLAILEALAHGLPIIATRVGGNPEIIDIIGRGFLVDYGDSNALSDAMLNATRLSESERTEYKKAALKAVEKTFEFKKFIKAHINLYKKTRRSGYFYF